MGCTIPWTFHMDSIGHMESKNGWVASQKTVCIPWTGVGIHPFHMEHTGVCKDLGGMVPWLLPSIPVIIPSLSH